jgi:hypothetical protein
MAQNDVPPTVVTVEDREAMDELMEELYGRFNNDDGINPALYWGSY